MSFVLELHQKPKSILSKTVNTQYILYIYLKKRIGK